MAKKSENIPEDIDFGLEEEIESDNLTEEDHFDFEEETEEEEEFLEIASKKRLKKETSSVPIGNLSKKTKGRSPRSRMANTREAKSRENFKRMDEIINSFTRNTKGKTYIPKSMMPKDHSIMWAREKIRQMDDPNNLYNLQQKGWEFCTADEMPQYAFYTNAEGVKDDAHHIKNGGLVLMKRHNYIHQKEIKYLEKISSRNNSLAKQYRDKSGEIDTFMEAGPPSSAFRTGKAPSSIVLSDE